ncbi:haloacid dehalogenase-like hydrolase [Prevotella melaninogenica]|uniref:HAD family hydrolase n=1 Tax=Prevotella melaninogenica TaxID=28132 RepID=UPI001C5FFFC8|nr:HAD family hydrolase [Prevotella melaninogenica]MBW4741079.1 haloacid dehalogenase-like hydrolase [Prevotella melaninogenica]MBW4913446.1 haloacid dehalogenase-like hydrolase [Prevotella melaninogenica]
MRKIYAFDFDGTLTTKDTLLEFIRFAKGSGQMFRGFLLFSPLLLLMKLHLYPNWKAKQQLFSYFFKGMNIDDFNAHCTHFAEQNKHLLRPAGIEKVRQAIEEEQAIVLIISASIDNWVRPFFDEIDKKIQVLGTQIETKEGHLTGQFTTKNCYGQEKVNRLTALYPHREAYDLIAFGDSRGDKELLDFADKGFYKPFRNKK